MVAPQIAGCPPECLPNVEALELLATNTIVEDDLTVAHGIFLIRTGRDVYAELPAPLGSALVLISDAADAAHVAIYLLRFVELPAPRSGPRERPSFGNASHGKPWRVPPSARYFAILFRSGLRHGNGGRYCRCRRHGDAVLACHDGAVAQDATRISDDRWFIQLIRPKGCGGILFWLAAA